MRPTRRRAASRISCGAISRSFGCWTIAKELGILASVSDEGDFWENRDVEALAREVGEWNQGMAALVGKLKDMFGGNIDAPITKFPNFEHLEAEGQKAPQKGYSMQCCFAEGSGIG